MLFVLDELMDNPAALVAYIAAFGVAIITGIAFHEFSHAWSAYELGDNTAARQGRLTLNPMRHLDPLGTAMIFLIGLGYGKPTPVNPFRLRIGPKAGNALVAIAGPMSNFVVALVASIPLRTGLIDSVASLNAIRDASGEEIVGLFLFFVIWINVLLGIFNLLPIHPLDGFKVVVGVLPGELSRQFAQLAPWGPGILMTLFVISFLAPPQFNILGGVLGGAADVVFELLL